MRPLRSATLLLACLAAAPAAAQPFDAYDPASLMARARQAMREGEMRDACVLIARAGQLAPHDVRVSLAWGDYEAAQRGLPVPEPAPPSVAPAAAPAAAPKPLEVAPEPPAPWPPR